MGARRGKWIVGILAVAAAAVVAGAVWYFWPLILFLRAFESLGRNVQGYPEYRHRSSGIVFVRLPGGTFEMGSPEDKAERGLHETLHTAIVSPFLIAKDNLNQQEWTLVMGTSTGPPWLASNDVWLVQLSSEHWRELIVKLNGTPTEKHGASSGFRLAGEAQREHACQAQVLTEVHLFSTDFEGRLDNLTMVLPRLAYYPIPPGL